MGWGKAKWAAIGAAAAAAVIMLTVWLWPRGTPVEAAQPGRRAPTNLPTQVFVRQPGRSAEQITSHYAAKIKSRPRLCWAAMSGDIDAIRQFIAAGDDVNERSTDGQETTVLLDAAGLGRDRGYDIVKLLLDKGADVNARHVGGYTAVMGAVRHHSPRTIELLLSRGASLEFTNVRGENALDWAKQEKDPKVIQIIEEAMKKQH